MFLAEPRRILDVLRCNRFQRRKFVSPCIVHKNIYPPQFFLDLRKQSLDVFRLGHVSLNRNRLPAFLLNSSDDRIRAILAAHIVHGHGGPFCRQMLRDGRSDSFRSPGYHRGLPLKSVHFPCFPRPSCRRLMSPVCISVCLGPFNDETVSERVYALHETPRVLTRRSRINVSSSWRGRSLRKL